MFFWTLPKFAEGTRFQKHSIWRHVVAVQFLIGSLVGRLLSDRVWAFSTNIWLMCIERESLFLNQRLHSRLINPCKGRTVLKDRAALNQGSCVSSPPSPLRLPGEQDGTVRVSACCPAGPPLPTERKVCPECEGSPRRSWNSVLTGLVSSLLKLKKETDYSQQFIQLGLQLFDYHKTCS